MNGINYYRVIYGLLIIVGVYLVVNNNVFVSPSHDVETLKLELDRVNAKVTDLQSKMAGQTGAGNKKYQNVIHQQVLEVVRVERNIYEKIQEHERHTRNFIISTLGVIIAFIGLSSLFGVQHFIRKIAEKAENDLTHIIKTKVGRAQAAVFNHMGYYRYEQYKDNGYSDEHKHVLDSAITSTEYAYDAFTHIRDSDELPLKHQVMNNLAYYLALRGKDEDRKTALSYAKISRNFGLKHPDVRWYDWSETYFFVLLKYGESHQLKFAFEYVDELLADQTILDREWKEKIEKKWKKLKEEYKGKLDKEKS